MSVVEKVVDGVGAVQEVVDGATLLVTSVVNCAAARNPCGTRRRKEKSAIAIRDMAHPLLEC